MPHGSAKQRPAAGGGRARRWLAAASAAAAALLVALALWLAAAFTASRPRESGLVGAAGLTAPARVIRDPHGVPHVFAANAHDAYFALGYAHAQDRFFQMDLTRRSVEGRLSELVGALTLKLDARARIKTLPAVIAAQTAGLSLPARAMLAAYAAGVNARLAQGAVAPEYALLFARPAPWRVEDSVAVGVAMTDNLTVGAQIDLARAELAGKLSRARLAQFFPDYPAWSPRSLDGAGGSNSWALTGARTATGKPIVANDPHLAFSAPGPFYLARLAWPGGDLVGATLPGAPLVVIGRNRDLAWTNTTNEVDSTDLVPAGKDVRAHEEGILVRGLFGPARAHAISVRETPQGPVLDPAYFDLGAFDGRAVALRSAALDRGNRVIDAMRQMNEARTVDQFVAASAGWTAPMAHILVASREGEMAMISAGALPLRDASGAWIGAIAPAARPIVKNPASEMLASANNLATPASFPYPTPGAYDPYRIARIRALLIAGASRDALAAIAMQRDERSLFAQRVLPALLRGAPNTNAGRAARKMMSRWDADMTADRPEPLIFAAWVAAFSRRLYGAQLGPELYPRHAGPRRTFLDSVLTGGAPAWCNEKACADLAGAALDEATALLRRRYGADPASWRWARAHTARFAHPLFGALPGLNALFNASTPIGGGGDAILATDYWGDDFAAIHGPSLRVAFDLADLNRSRFMIAPGQSGQPASPHYRDLLADWAAGRSFEIRTDINPDKPPAGFEMLTLTPK